MSKFQTLFSSLVNPTNWQEGAANDEFQQTLESYFDRKAYLVNSGRSAIYLLLKAAGIGAGDEVLIQAYTCNAVPNPIIWTGAKPVYVDINPETLNANVGDLKRKISGKTRAILLQHTFGRPGPLEETLELAKSNNLILIEDCAHSLGATHKSRKLGTFGDVAILSFGREKVISSLAGGAIIINNQKLEKPIATLVSELGSMPMSRISSEVLNFFTWRLLLRKIYFSKTGDRFIKGLNHHDFFNVVTSRKEKEGERPDVYPGKMPSIFAQIALEEFTNLDKYNTQRRKTAEFYLENVKNPDFRLLPDHEGIYLRFVALHQKAAEVLAAARERKLWFGSWYNSPIFPKGVNEEKLGYHPGSCPVAEEIANQTINLPVYLGITEEEEAEVVEFINSFK